MANLLYLFILYALLKIVINFTKYLQCKYFYDRYIKWLAGLDLNLKRSQHTVIKLFKDAGVKDSYFTVSTPTGWGYISNRNISVFDNFPSRREDIVGIIAGMFNQAIGIYSSRTMEVFNPIYWIEFIIYLPKNMFTYLGISPDSILIKIGQIAYWTVSSVITVFCFIYEDEVRDIIQNVINSM
jgi:hypothetical protein